MYVYVVCCLVSSESLEGDYSDEDASEQPRRVAAYNLLQVDDDDELPSSNESDDDAGRPPARAAQAKKVDKKPAKAAKKEKARRVNGTATAKDDVDQLVALIEDASNRPAQLDAAALEKKRAKRERQKAAAKKKAEEMAKGGETPQVDDKEKAEDGTTNKATKAPTAAAKKPPTKGARREESPKVDVTTDGNVEAEVVPKEKPIAADVQEEKKKKKGKAEKPTDAKEKKKKTPLPESTPKVAVEQSYPPDIVEETAEERPIGRSLQRLDIRRTNVQDSEAGGITQQIGATFVPQETLKAQAKMVPEVDRLYDWKGNPNKDIRQTLKLQQSNATIEFRERVKEVIGHFAEQGLNAILFWENKDLDDYISLVPTSAHTGDGMGNLMAAIVHFCQTKLSKRLEFKPALQCTVLEVKQISGLGTTIDVILVNGFLRVGDIIVVAGSEGPIVSQIRELLMPHPLRELRVKNPYLHNKVVRGAQGVKVVAKDLEKALAGLPLLVAKSEDDIEELKYFGINVGPVHKRDVMKASAMLERDSQ
ncbi:elongation factor Tu domain 2 [Trichuris suis]|nr:elongation factor Tu domain 2 [Trichuris suis]